MAARDRRVGALRRFTSWCIHRRWWWVEEISWVSTTYLGAIQLKKSDIEKWSRPLYDAFLSGVWILYWTEDTLFWVAKPTVHTEKTERGRRLHKERSAAVESDIENLYFWHGVLVPAFVVVSPDWITERDIDTEPNAEVRRVMLERYGLDRYLLSGQILDSMEEYRIVEKQFNGSPMRALIMRCPTTGAAYVHPVHPAVSTVEEALAWKRGHDDFRVKTKYRQGLVWER